MQNVIHHFTQLAADRRCTFLGNVTVGTDVSIEELRSRYDAVVLAYGAESDKRLDIPGEVRAVPVCLMLPQGIQRNGCQIGRALPYTVRDLQFFC